MHKRQGGSLGWRMMMIVAGIPLLLVVPIMLFVGQQYRDAYHSAFRSRAYLATVQVEQMIDAFLPLGETGAGVTDLAPVLEDLAASVQDFDFVAVVDDSGRIIESSLPNQEGRVFPELGRLQQGAMQYREGDQVYYVVSRNLDQVDRYLTWRALQMSDSPDVAYYVVVSERASAVEPTPVPLIIIGVAGAVGIAVLTRLSLYRLVLVPLRKLTEGADIMGQGDLAYRISIDRVDEFGIVAKSLNAMAGRVGELVSDLERRVESRTAALKRRNAQLEAVSLVAQEAARQHNVSALLDTAVDAIAENFGFYHTGVFILDDSREWAILRAASSEGGKRMLSRGHRLQVGKVGIVGYVAANGRPRIALNVGQDAVWFQNPDLPDTRAEMAVPLVTDNGVVGVLDVQSNTLGEVGGTTFTDDDISTLQLLADQLAVALANARILETMAATLNELQSLQVDYSRRGWARVTQRMRPMAYEYDRVGTLPVAPLPIPEDLSNGHVSHKIMMDGGVPVVMEALRVGGQTLGYLGLSDTQRAWSEEELSLIGSVGEQVALALENARLFEDTQRNERQQYLISSVLQVASNPEFSAEVILGEIARILAQGLDMAVVIFTFPNAGQPVVRSHAVVDPEGRQLALFEDDVTLTQGQYLFFQGLETADFGPMIAMPGVTGQRDETFSSQARLRPTALVDLYDLERVLYVPIRSAGVRSGIMGLIQRQASPPLDPDTRELAHSLATQIAVVLENLSLTEETRLRSEELRQLYRISLSLSEQRTPDDVLNLIAEQGAGLLDADAANLWLYEPESETLRLALDYGGGAEGHLSFETRGDEGLAGAALARQQTIFVDDYATWDGRLSDLVSLRFRAMIAVPLVGRFGPLGVLVLLSEQVGSFGEREAGLADLFSAQAATALENARLTEDAQRRAGEFSQLYEAGIDLITILDAEALLSRAADWAREVFGAARAVVTVKYPGAEVLVQGVSVEDSRYALSEDSALPNGEGLTDTLMRTRESILVQDNRTSSLPSAHRLVTSGLLSQIGTPLQVGDEVLGALLVDGAAAGQFGQRDLDLLEFLSTQVSSALQNSIQFGQTEQALAVVGRQARYQANISQAVALLNEQGTESAAAVFGLLAEAADVPAVLYFELATNSDQPTWALAESWASDGYRIEGLDGLGLRALPLDGLGPWAQMLLEQGHAMATRDALVAGERSILNYFEFETVLGLAVAGQGQSPGFLALFRDDAVLWSEQEVVALQTVAAALSNTLARENLFQQVQTTLNETEALYRGSAVLSEANTYQGILEVLLEHTVLGRQAQTATIQLFDRSWSGEERPEYSELVAYWANEPQPRLRRRYSVGRFPAAIELMQDGSPVFIEDLTNDTVLDRRARALFHRVMGSRSVVLIPLLVGGQRIGYLHADYAEPQVFSEAERRRLISLSQQASIAALNVRQLRATEARVRREQLIREITGRIQEAPDVEGVLQNAVRELGRAFGTSRSRIQVRPTQENASDEVGHA